jgi:GNAT superfamily N-acetyltransferase
MAARQLDASDAGALEAFLVVQRDTSMFLRSNARRSGLEYRGERYQATYVAEFRGAAVAGVVAHSWNGMLLLQAPDRVGDLALACVKCSRRPVTGFSGPAEQVLAARRALGLSHAPAALDDDESLFVLELSELVLPQALLAERMVCRPPLAHERGTLCAWRHAYSMETLGAADSEAARQQAASTLDAQIAEGNVWVAVAEGEPVSLSAFNAALPDIVQLGGIYTPPPLRGRGFAKAAVAASLLAARQRGADRGVLFTNNPSAVRTYEAVGFRRAGDFGLVILR